MNRICHLTTVHKRYDGRIFFKECQSLAKAGYEVFLIVSDNMPDEYRDGVHIISTGFVASNRFYRMIVSTRKTYEKALKVDADIYHLHDPELLPIGLKLKKHGKIVIFDSHECYSEQLKHKPYLPPLVTYPLAFFYSIYETWTLNNFDAAIVAATIEGKNPLKNIDKKIVVVGNEPLLDEFYNKYDSTIPKVERSVCYIGWLRKDRGIINDMLAAYRANARLILAGQFETGFLEELKQYKEFECVDYRGFLERDNLAELLSTCMVGLYIERDVGQNLKIDALGTKVFEYMSMGLPVIISKCRYHQEMIDKYRFGICVDPENVEEISSAMQKCLGDLELMERMGENGRLAAKNSLNWSTEEAKLINLYKELLV